MPVNTKKVTGRRTLHFKSLDDMLADAESVSSVGVRCLGNWSAGQIFQHLALALNSAIDGVTYTPPWFVRTFARMMKRQFLTNTMRPGFQMPKGMEADFLPPSGISSDDGLCALRAAIARFRTKPALAPNKVFGMMTYDEVEQFHCRHAEMHLSFLVPETAA